MKILIVDDEKDIRNIIAITLLSYGYEVLEAENGKVALQKFDDTISLVLLDVMMDEMDGIETCKKIRELSDVPVVFITAKGEDIDKLTGFMVGADDYIEKPFNTLEVVARIKAILNRCKNNVKKDNVSVINIEDLSLDLNSHRVFKDDEEINLTKTEFALLSTLALNKGQVFDNETLLKVITGERYFTGENTLATHIRKIRKKIGDNTKNTKYIKTVWGVGYRVD
jgi:DNA-binding response OmpR family regulator